jgi:hypothetical protein
MNDVEVSSCCFYFILKFGLLFYLKLFFYIEKQKQIHKKNNGFALIILLFILSLPHARPPPGFDSPRSHTGTADFLHAWHSDRSRLPATTHSGRQPQYSPDHPAGACPRAPLRPHGVAMAPAKASVATVLADDGVLQHHGHGPWKLRLPF